MEQNHNMFVLLNQINRNGFRQFGAAQLDGSQQADGMLNKNRSLQAPPTDITKIPMQGLKKRNGQAPSLERVGSLTVGEDFL